MPWTTLGTVSPGDVLRANSGTAAYNTIIGNVKVGHPLVSTLPASPDDGDTVYLQTAAMATAGIVWTFRYRAAAGTYKWEFVGGPAWTAEIETSQNTASNNVPVDLATVGPSVTVPVAGEYVTTGCARGFNNFAGANRAFIGVAIGAGTPSNTAQADIPTQNHLASLSIVDIQTATAGQEFRLRYQSANSTMAFASRTLQVLPRAVS
jgi:hypothetical protein